MILTEAFCFAAYSAVPMAAAASSGLILPVTRIPIQSVFPEIITTASLIILSEPLRAMILILSSSSLKAAISSYPVLPNSTIFFVNFLPMPRRHWLNVSSLADYIWLNNAWKLPVFIFEATRFITIRGALTYSTCFLSLK